MKKSTFLSLFLISFLFTSAQTGIPVTQLSACDGMIEDFMADWDIPGGTVALARNGKLIYARAFGYADQDLSELVQPYHMFRIASVSKPITAVAIMKMVEDGEINLSDQVFGVGGIFESNTYFMESDITDDRIYDITVQQLLEHTAGWNSGIDCVPNPTTPYTFDWNNCSPISFPLHVTYTLGEENPVSEEALIRFLLQKGLNDDPGTIYNYSNIGYLILGKIIEEKSGMLYEDWVRENVLAPAGICDMYIAKNLLEDKREREGEYNNTATTLSIYGTGEYVPWQYGGFNVESMDGHGGWIATASDLVRLLVAVDNFPTKPDILSSATINEMVTPSAENPGYAKGWQVNAFDNWWHSGSLDGTSSFFGRSSGGFTWAMIFNKRNEGNDYWTAFDALPWDCFFSTATYPSFDLMLSPNENGYSISFSNVYDNAMDISWENGDGENRILIAKEGSPVDAFPLDGIEYSGNPEFGTGDEIGNGNFVVMNGTENTVSLSGLNPLTTYYFREFEYNNNAATGNYPLYKLCNSEIKSQATSNETAIHDLNNNGFIMYPNPATNILLIDGVKNANSIDITIYDCLMNKIYNAVISNSNQLQVNVQSLAQGIYTLQLEIEGKQYYQSFIKQ